MKGESQYAQQPPEESTETYENWRILCSSKGYKFCERTSVLQFANSHNFAHFSKSFCAPLAAPPANLGPIRDLWTSRKSSYTFPCSGKKRTVEDLEKHESYELHRSECILNLLLLPSILFKKRSPLFKVNNSQPTEIAVWDTGTDVFLGDIQMIGQITCLNPILMATQRRISLRLRTWGSPPLIG